MRVISFLVAIACLGTLVTLVTAAERPNIVLVMADDQGWGDVGYRGPTVLKTPTLDAMAAKNLVLERFYAAAPVCSPTRGSVMTGRHPNRFECFSWGYTLRPQEVTVAEALQQAGYVTGHFGKWHLGSLDPRSPVNPGANGFDEWFSSPNFFDNDPLMSHKGKVVHMQGESSKVTADAAIKFMRTAAEHERPFLAVVWFGSPHLPYIALPEDQQQYADLPKRQRDYYCEITAMDRAVGQLRAALRRLKIADNTLFWYTSDNGGKSDASNGGLAGHKGQLLEGGIREPTIIEWPARIKTHRVSYVPAGTVDIYPTLVDLVGVTVKAQPKPLDGISLLPLIDGKMTARDKPLGFWVYPIKGIPIRSTQLLQQIERRRTTGAVGGDAAPLPELFSLSPETLARVKDHLPGKSAWIDGDWKLHRDATRQGRVTYQLFNLGEDIKETHDVAAQHPERLEQMKTQLGQWQQSVVDSMSGKDYTK